jgi:cyclopropane-fatty-acyl-phospholipid synthase
MESSTSIGQPDGWVHLLQPSSREGELANGSRRSKPRQEDAHMLQHHRRTDHLGAFVTTLVQTATTPFAVRLGDGRFFMGDAPPQFVLEFPSPDTLSRLLREGRVAAFAESYVRGELLVHGDVSAAVGLVASLRHLFPADAAPASPSRGRTDQSDARDICHHYELPEAFFRLFLDQHMVYSCAYFSSASESLEDAQLNKLDLCCQKLDLHPNERFLDVGCGWGSLLFRAVQAYGVRGEGITLSPSQAQSVNRRAAGLGLAERAYASVRHYAELDGEPVDKVASVGMVEHVGVERLSEYFQALARMLRPGGRLLNHGISVPRVRSVQLGGEFISQYVFPGSELVPVGDMVNAIEDAGLEVLDVQSLRPHYVRTLGHWAQRFFSRRTEAAQLVSGATLRTWDVFLPACREAFETGLLGVHQIVAFKPDPSGRRSAPLARVGLFPSLA